MIVSLPDPLVRILIKSSNNAATAFDAATDPSFAKVSCTCTLFNAGLTVVFLLTLCETLFKWRGFV